MRETDDGQWWQQVPVRLGLALALIGLLAIGSGAYLNWRPAAKEPVAFETMAFETGNLMPDSLPLADVSAVPTALPLVLVYISGAVMAPDVYALPADARVKDLVLAAGGLTEQADHSVLNLAAGLSDGQHVHVPAHGEAATLPDAVGPTMAVAAGLIDINRASVVELAELPGIGEAIAERIVAYRADNGPFAAIEDVQNVKGIGPALYEKIQSSITANP